MRDSEEASPFRKLVSIGDHRLVLRWIEVPDCSPPEPGWHAWDFHSLVWEVREGEGWRGHATISKEDLEGDGTDRWFADLHSFDPVAGAAVVKVAEEQPPDAEGQCCVEYSWQKWDLLNKRRSRFLRLCDSPFDGLDPRAGLRWRDIVRRYRSLDALRRAGRGAGTAIRRMLRSDVGPGERMW